MDSEVICLDRLTIEFGKHALTDGHNDLYLDWIQWIGHSPCNDGYVFAMLNVRLQNHANYATMVTYCGAACNVHWKF